jgi:hypothetical protein
MAPIYLGHVSSTWVEELPRRLGRLQPGQSEVEVLCRLGRARALAKNLVCYEVLPGRRVNIVHELVEHNDDWTMMRRRYDLELLYSDPGIGLQRR